MKRWGVYVCRNINDFCNKLFFPIQKFSYNCYLNNFAYNFDSYLEIFCTTTVELYHYSTHRGQWGNGNCPVYGINILMLRQDDYHFTDNIFRCLFSNGNFWINISLKFVPQGQINNIPTLIQLMAWHQQGDKPLSETMVVRLLTHKWVPQSQWVKGSALSQPSCKQSIEK